DRHSGDVQQARRRRSVARVLPRQGARARQPRGDARQDLSSGRRALVGLPHAERRGEVGARAAERAQADAAVIAHELTPAPDPVACCERLAGLPYRMFLDSAQRGSPLGRYSFLTADPATVVRRKGADARGALDEVRALLASRASDAIPGLPPFQTGAAGYL